ncbi:MAG: M3 family oligoendopeptidase [Armatimonadetes bacterium]|nr:M3 family oligoendopeptidase [Armatimonadota bacterium]
MSIAQELAPPKVRWDLSSLFSSPDDPKIESTWAAARKTADAFAKKYRGNVASLDAAGLAKAIKEYEDLAVSVAKPTGYASLLFTCDSGSPSVGAFMQKQMEYASELNVQVLFFELEIQALPEAQAAKMLADPVLANYSHYIKVARQFSPHRMSEKEEVILEETANTGSRAWVRLFEEVTSNHVYHLKLPGKPAAELSQSEVLALFRDPNRETRVAACECLSKGLKEQERVLTFISNNLWQDKNVDDRLRKFEYPEQARHLSNELDKETVDLVIKLCKKHYGLVERFYNIKREILGLPELTHADRYAPLFETHEMVEWEKAKSIVLESFGKFSPTLSSEAKAFFDNNWIDAEPRKGKQGGAFCSYNTPDLHPVVFLNYLNKMDDVMTLAHELGHGVHASLSREQTYLNFIGTLPLAELASTFGEMLVFESLVKEAKLEDKLALYGEKIEGIFATIFRQAAMFQFESACHRARREEGELSPERVGEIWQEKIQEMFGNSLTLGEEHSLWWSYVSHFIASPFYVYAYSFGELLVLSLYEMAKKEGPSFAGRYEKLLRLGGSQSPAELMHSVGVDLKSEKFWLGGFEALEKLINSFEGFWREYKKA